MSEGFERKNRVEEIALNSAKEWRIHEVLYNHQLVDRSVRGKIWQLNLASKLCRQMFIVSGSPDGERLCWFAVVSDMVVSFKSFQCILPHWFSLGLDF